MAVIRKTGRGYDADITDTKDADFGHDSPLSPSVSNIVLAQRASCCVATEYRTPSYVLVGPVTLSDITRTLHRWSDRF